VPELSCLIPTHNRAEFLKEALESIRRQTFQDFQVFIYDDGSTDDTFSVVSEFKDDYPNTIYLFGHKNQGVAFARNRLFDLATNLNPYCIWQDSDDISNEFRFEYMLRAIKAQDADIAFSQLQFFAHPNKPVKNNIIRSIDTSRYTSREGLYDNMNFATAIFKSRICDIPFKDSLRKREDVDWLTKLIRMGTKFGYLEKPLYWARRHEGRLTYTL
jgi:glycosyltransferase involved in cell wall biosynthesis